MFNRLLRLCFFASVASVTSGLIGVSAQAKVTAEQLASIRLPPGFRISVFAEDVAGARQMTLSPKGTLFIGSRQGSHVYAVPDAAQAAARGETAKKVLTIGEGLSSPNGVAFKNGDLFVAEISRISKYPGIEAKLGAPPKPVVVRGDYPTDEHHGWKYIAFGPDGWLYVPVGAPCNVCKKDDPIYASLTRLSPDFKRREIFATGIRNTVGFDWQPSTKVLWFTDNGVDMLGDNVPSDELNRAPKEGLDFGFPQCHQGNVPDPKFGKSASCGAGGPFTPPAQKLGPHVAALGMKFYTGAMFPAKYKGSVFIAEHGSWNRTEKIGYRVTNVPVQGDKAKGYDVFAEGWKQGESAWGRPVDVLLLPDGSMLVSDDTANAIYRISYKK